MSGPHETPESDAADTWTSLADESYCYVTTVGRRTGEPHTIEIWFVLRGQTIYLLSGGGRRSDWVRNLMQTSDVVVRIGDRRFSGRGRVVDDPDEERLVRDLLPAKYRPGYTGDLSSWQRRALPVAIELSPSGDD
ncbi:MAG TPA: nitroreductase family deazaflavin-dependent oxidoreductase [Actinomycetota bacterium]|nr:nitroreductase family deazaflavin-dependent oxidoreductase [Actinomycetota bacterium]